MNAKAAAAPSASTASSSRALAFDPLDDILTGFYRPPAPGRKPAATPPPAALDSGGADDDAEAEPADCEPAKKPRPTHYKVVCISLYVEDIDRLDGLVAELKRRGHTKANKSQVIRAALEQIDLDQVPRSH